MPPNTAPKTIGRYEIVDRIGYGGVGVVFRARDPRLGRSVAIKLLRVAGADVRARFVREAQAAGNLKHRNIVTVYDFGEHDGQPFIVMEYVEGTTLAEVIRRGPGLPLARKLELMEELATALAYAHQRGLIHRDIKPANLMLDVEGTLRILDFGIARTAQSQITAAGAKLGTLNYMSPEAIEGGVIDRRSDIFAVGLVFYELLSLRPGFSSEQVSRVLDDIVHRTPQPVSEICANLDPAIDQIVDRAIQKDPAKRYQVLEAMAADIARVRRRLEREQAAAEPATMYVPPPPAAVDRTRRLPKVAAAEGDAKAAPDQSTAMREAQRREQERRDEEVRRRREQDKWIAEQVELAKTAFAAHDYTAAIRTLEGVQQTAPGIELIADLLSEARVADAERRIELQIEAQVADSLARARALLAKDDLTSALAAADEAAAFAPDHLEAFKIRRSIEARIIARRREEELARDVRWAIEYTTELFERGGHTGALALLRAFRPKDPLILKTIDDLDARLFDIVRARVEPDRAAVRRLCASAREAVQRSDFDAALRALDEAAAIERDNEEVAALRGRTEAQAAFDKARQRVEHEYQARNAIDAARKRVGQNDAAGAIEDLERFVPPHPIVTEFLEQLRASGSAVARPDSKREPPDQPKKAKRLHP